jgi:hypothetical protein
MATEEERAAEFRRTQAARAANTCTRERLLAGSPSARRTLWENWKTWVLPQPTVAETPDSDRVN